MATTLELQTADTNTKVTQIVQTLAGLPAAIAAAIAANPPTATVDLTPITNILTPLATSIGAIATGVADIQAQVDQPAPPAPAAGSGSGTAAPAPAAGTPAPAAGA